MRIVMRNRRDPDLNTALDLLRELFHIHICFLDSTEAIESFVASYHFHDAQTSITIENIRQHTAGRTDEMVYLTDSFSIQYLLFHFDLRPIVKSITLLLTTLIIPPMRSGGKTASASWKSVIPTSRNLCWISKREM